MFNDQPSCRSSSGTLVPIYRLGKRTAFPYLKKEEGFTLYFRGRAIANVDKLVPASAGVKSFRELVGLYSDM